MWPPTWFVTQAAARKRAAFMTIPARPSVRSVIGNESIFTTGLTSPFAMPNTIAMIAKVARSPGSLWKADEGIVIPVTNRAVTQRATPVAMRLATNPFTLVPPCDAPRRRADAGRSPGDHPTPGPRSARRLGRQWRNPAPWVGRADRGPGSAEEKARPDRVRRVEDERLAPGRVGAPLHLGDHRRPPGDHRRADDPTREHRIDDAQVAQHLAGPESALRMQDREARRCPASAGRAVHLAIREDGHVALGQRRPVARSGRLVLPPGDAVDAAQLGLVPVSYTHLRAHETRHDLVCR